MSGYVNTGGRFPTPLLCILPPEVEVRLQGDGPHGRLTFRGGHPVLPYSLQVVDGQHRAFCYYLSSNPNPQPVDVNCYILSNEDDRPFVASSLFLNVNYKPIRPPIELALVHHAQAAVWPRGWVGRKKSSGYPEDQGELNSPRILATRFLYELNLPGRMFEESFKLEGARGSDKAPIQSITTYLSEDFDIPNPSDPNNPIARLWGTVAGASRIWTSPDPTPESLRPLWAALVSEFESFVSSVTSAPAPPGEPASKDLLWSLIRGNNNVFVALWKLYFWSRVGRTDPRTGAAISLPNWPIANASAHRIMDKLREFHGDGKLTGRRALYHTGTGRRRSRRICSE